MRGSRGAQIIEQVMPDTGEVVFKKTRFSAFYRTALEEWLSDNQIDELGLMGYSADVCVRFTAVDAYNRDFAVTLLEDCVLPERETNAESVEYLQWLTNCQVASSATWTANHRR